MALDYAALEAAVTTLLGADPRLDGVTITRDPEPPTTEQCPAILVSVTGFARVPWQLTGGLAVPGTYHETATLQCQCWEFSGQGGGAARAQCFALVEALTAVLADSPQVGAPTAGAVLVVQTLRGNFQSAPSDGGGIFWVAVVEVECQALT
jgi:hypothetical protein